MGREKRKDSFVVSLQSCPFFDITLASKNGIYCTAFPVKIRYNKFETLFKKIGRWKREKIWCKVTKKKKSPNTPPLWNWRSLKKKKKKHLIILNWCLGYSSLAACSQYPVRAPLFMGSNVLRFDRFSWGEGRHSSFPFPYPGYGPDSRWDNNKYWQPTSPQITKEYSPK